LALDFIEIQDKIKISEIKEISEISENKSLGKANNSAQFLIKKNDKKSEFLKWCSMSEINALAENDFKFSINVLVKKIISQFNVKNYIDFYEV